LNYVQTTYGVMDEVFQLVATFKDFPPRSFPPNLNPANIMESAMDDYKTRKMLRVEVRGALNRVFEQWQPKAARSRRAAGKQPRREADYQGANCRL
jgi:hypothetical protein